MGNCQSYTDNCDVGYSFTVIFILVAFTLLTIAFITMLRAFYCPECLKKGHEKTPKQPLKYFQITAIASFVCGLGCILCDFVHVIEGWTIPIGLRDDYFKPLRTAANIFAFQSYILTDLVIFGRLYYSFHLSQYKLSIYLLSYIFILLVFIIICDILYLILLMTEWSALIDIKSEILLLFIIFELVLSISMSLIFSKKLHQVLSPYDDEQSNTVRQNVEITNTDTAAADISSGDGDGNGHSTKKLKTAISRTISVKNVDDNKIDLNKMQINLLNLSTKNTIITGIAACYFAFRFGYRQFAIRYDENENIEPIWMVSYLSRTYVFVTNGVAVYFGFIFSAKLYYKLFGKCHISMYKLCSKCAKREIRNNVIQSIQQEITMELTVNTEQQQNTELTEPPLR